MVLDLFGDICPRCRILLTIEERRCPSCGFVLPEEDGDR